ncbi:hypothetical protein BDY19DRAFT_604635 [Irpex rosettiformis]|uniref:Uncharacterized protein n=1 Tax=Irpex rosettiformis TaxID=378272 RepID=A0ACB8TPL7_9APHY|nr:hypothetical protein BDY19DRAFT_604635 [Irpex rosettiformis]
MIESGSLYCISWTTVLAAYVSTSRVLDVVLLSSVAQLTAMYPTLIIVLVCLRTAKSDSSYGSDLHLNVDETTNAKAAIISIPRPEPARFNYSSVVPSVIPQGINASRELPSHTSSDKECKIPRSACSPTIRWRDLPVITSALN